MSSLRQHRIQEMTQDVRKSVRHLVDAIGQFWGASMPSLRFRSGRQGNALGGQRSRRDAACNRTGDCTQCCQHRIFLTAEAQTGDRALCRDGPQDALFDAQHDVLVVQLMERLMTPSSVPSLALFP